MGMQPFGSQYSGLTSDEMGFSSFATNSPAGSSAFGYGGSMSSHSGNADSFNKPYSNSASTYDRTGSSSRYGNAVSTYSTSGSSPYSNSNLNYRNSGLSNSNSGSTYGTSGSAYGTSGSKYGTGSTYRASGLTYGNSGSTYGTSSSTHGTSDLTFGSSGSSTNSNSDSAYGNSGSTFGNSGTTYGNSGSTYGNSGLTYDNYGRSGSSRSSNSGSTYDNSDSTYGTYARFGSSINGNSGSTYDNSGSTYDNANSRELTGASLITSSSSSTAMSDENSDMGTSLSRFGAGHDQSNSNYGLSDPNYSTLGSTYVNSDPSFRSSSSTNDNFGQRFGNADSTYSTGGSTYANPDSTYGAADSTYSYNSAPQETSRVSISLSNSVIQDNSNSGSSSSSSASYSYGASRFSPSQDTSNSDSSYENARHQYGGFLSSSESTSNDGSQNKGLYVQQSAETVSSSNTESDNSQPIYDPNPLFSGVPYKSSNSFGNSGTSFLYDYNAAPVPDDDNSNYHRESSTNTITSPYSASEGRYSTSESGSLHVSGHSDRNTSNGLILQQNSIMTSSQVSSNKPSETGSYTSETVGRNSPIIGLSSNRMNDDETPRYNNYYHTSYSSVNDNAGDRFSASQLRFGSDATDSYGKVVTGRSQNNPSHAPYVSQHGSDHLTPTGTNQSEIRGWQNFVSLSATNNYTSYNFLQSSSHEPSANERQHQSANGRYSNHVSSNIHDPHQQRDTNAQETRYSTKFVSLLVLVLFAGFSAHCVFISNVFE